MTGVRRIVPALGVPAMLVAAFVVTVGFAGADYDTATSHEGAATLSFGFPLEWVEQDQRALDPEYPLAVSWDSPWEHPTSYSVLPFLVDLALVLALLGLLLLAASRVVEWSRSRPAVLWSAVVLAPVLSLVAKSAFYWDAQDTTHLPSAAFAVLVVNGTAALITVLATRNPEDRRFRRLMLWVLVATSAVELMAAGWMNAIDKVWE